MDGDAWTEAVRGSAASYRRMIDGAVAQLSDAELRARPRPGMNSVAVILRHLAGNLLSRWTDFLTTDGEKPDRRREQEFLDWEGDRASLLARFDAGWNALVNALQEIDATTWDRPVFIRGERLTVADATLRALTHIGYHAGQIVLVARLVHDGPWHWLTIPPGGGAPHDRQSSGAAASRDAADEEPPAP
jgi:uncharacterized damage-inducible protein DinB